MTYRDDLAALRARHDELADELSRLRAERRRLEGVAQRASNLEQEVAELRKKLEAMQVKRSLPVLEDVQIASPCSENWEDMVGDQRTRFCVKCDKNVYDVSAMTRDEAETLIASTEGSDELCLRLYRRQDGTILTADCAVGRRRRRVTRVAAAAAVFGGAAAALSYGATATTASEMSIQAPTIDPADFPADEPEIPVMRPRTMGVSRRVLPSESQKGGHARTMPTPKR
jgi:hypothetical protein